MVYNVLSAAIHKFYMFRGILRSLHFAVALNGNVHVCRQKCDFAWRTFHSQFYSCLSWIYSTLTEFHLLWRTPASAHSRRTLRTKLTLCGVLVSNHKHKKTSNLRYSFNLIIGREETFLARSRITAVPCFACRFSIYGKNTPASAHSRRTL